MVDSEKYEIVFVVDAAENTTRCHLGLEQHSRLEKKWVFEQSSSDLWRLKQEELSKRQVSSRKTIGMKLRHMKLGCNHAHNVRQASDATEHGEAQTTVRPEVCLR